MANLKFVLFVSLTALVNVRPSVATKFADDADLELKIEKHLQNWLQKFEPELKSCSGLREQLETLQNELRAVASQASQCDDVKETMRQAENDHVVVHWLKDSVAEIRREIVEIASTATTTTADVAATSQAVTELRQVIAHEVQGLRHEMQKVEFSAEAATVCFFKFLAKMGTLTFFLLTHFPLTHYRQTNLT